MNRWCIRVGLASLVSALAPCALAVVVAPGETRALLGTNPTASPWLVAPSPFFVPGGFFVRGPDGVSAVFAGQWIVSFKIAPPLSLPILNYRLQTTYAEGTRRIVAVEFTGYAPFAIETEFLSEATNNNEPKRVVRSADGDTLRFEFETPILADQTTKFFYAMTNATQHANVGTMRVILNTGEIGIVNNFPVPVMPAAQAPCPGDNTGDGVINFADLNSVLTNFGNACP